MVGSEVPGDVPTSTSEGKTPVDDFLSVVMMVVWPVMPRKVRMTSDMVFYPGKLVLSIVAHDQGDAVVSATRAAGARGGTIIHGRGDSSSLLDILGLHDSTQDIVLTLINDDEATAVFQAVKACNPQKKNLGVALLIDVRGILRHMTAAGTSENIHGTRSNTMSKTSSHVLISFIVNKGTADDAMAAARKAGASGGTIINAQGTAKEDDVKFFGITLVPEKEMLLTIVPQDKATSIIEAVKSVPSLEEPGAGIAFTVDIIDFAFLGR